jgi:hypothetical protein
MSRHRKLIQMILERNFGPHVFQGLSETPGFHSISAWRIIDGAEFDAMRVMSLRGKVSQLEANVHRPSMTKLI